MNKETPVPVIIALLTVITIVFWVGFEIYRSFTIQEEPDVPPEISQPLNPDLDQAALTAIESRIFLTDAQIGNPIFEATPTPTPTPLPEEVILEEEATISTESATPEGEATSEGATQ